MLIGNRYADNKMYRGVKHYDHMPLTCDDLHESSDTNFMKNAYIMNNLLGYGLLNTPDIAISNTGMRLSTPSVVMIDGDVSIIQSDDDTAFVSKQSAVDAGYAEGVVCIVGWYQHISVMSTLRNYGGVDNSTLPNDIKDDRYATAISSRYQLRWFPVIISKSDFSSETISLEIDDRDIDGNKLETQSTITSTSKINNVFIASKPTSMDYANSDLYIVPLFGYSLSNGSITKANSFDKLRSGSPFFNSETEPTGMISEGATWYNPITREFKTYVGESGGFVSSASKMAFLQYQSIYTVETATTTPQDITVPVGVNSFQEGDILRVIYEGLELASTLNYTVNYTNKTIKLLNFTTEVGDVIYFTVTRIVEANDITNVTETFIRHISTTGSGTVEAHVKLSDTLSSSGVNGGVAATPKLVNDTKSAMETYTDTQVSSVQSNLNTLNSDYSTFKTTTNSTITSLQQSVQNAQILTDESTGKRYKFGVKDGQLYIEEV